MNDSVSIDRHAAGDTTPQGPEYAGIGSRKTPGTVMEIMGRLSRRLAEEGWTLRSGGADGADAAFAAGAPANRRTLYLPWRSYNEIPDGVVMNPAEQIKAEAFVRRYHPAWSRCGRGARALHARKRGDHPRPDAGPAGAGRNLLDARGRGRRRDGDRDGDGSRAGDTGAEPGPAGRGPGAAVDAGHRETMESGVDQAFALDFRYNVRLRTSSTVRAGPIEADIREAASWRDGDRSGLTGKRMRILVRTNNSTALEVLRRVPETDRGRAEELARATRNEPGAGPVNLPELARCLYPEPMSALEHLLAQTTPRIRTENRLSDRFKVWALQLLLNTEAGSGDRVVHEGRVAHPLGAAPQPRAVQAGIEAALGNPIGARSDC